MKLQLALDIIPLNEAIELTKKVKDYIDWIEVGTPLIKKEGIRAVEEIRKAFPKETIVADLKTIDAGKWEAELGFSSGADIINVLGCANDSTILNTLKIAEKYNKSIIADLLGVENKVIRAKGLENLGVHYLGIHTASDEQTRGISPLEELEIISKIAKIPLVVAGGINLRTIDEILKFHPDIIVVGSGITKAEDPEKTAKALRDKIKKFYEGKGE